MGAVNEGPRGGEPRRAGDVLDGLREVLRERGIAPHDCSDDTPESRTREVRARQAETARQVWLSTLESWPDDDFTGASLQKLDADQQAPGILRWMQDPRARMLILSGSTGRGKSFAAFAIANHYASLGRSVRAVKHHRYVEALLPDSEDAPERRSESAARMKQRVMDADLFVLDEFGGGMPTTREGHARPFAQRVTSDLLSMKLRADGRRTVITTNLSYKAIQALFEDRVLSRLLQAATVLEITGPDRRSVRHATSWRELQ